MHVSTRLSNLQNVTPFRKRLMVVAAVITTMSSVCSAQAREVVIPEISIPRRVIPGRTIPGVVIPAREGKFGRIPEIVIPPIVIPDIVLPAINTVRQVIELREYDLVSRQDLVMYEQRQVAVVAPLQMTHTQMSRDDRIEAFRRLDRRSSYALLNLLADADLDLSGDLSWIELHAFQQTLMETYDYQTNQVALHPTDFMFAGGGDCEDFALVTTLLAKFWGWDGFIACFFDDQMGHAIALIHSPVSIPGYYQRLEISNWSTIKGDPVPDGTYVPVDYEHVGGYSGALRAGMRLDYILNPKRIIGEAM